jgi:ATP-dependent protease ClpP protease subunit
MHESCGGCWFDGMAMFDSIMFATAPITILAYTRVCSMSTIILQAADNRVLMPNADFMVHFGTESEENHYLGFMTGADFRKKYTPKMLSIYAKRCINGKFFQEYYKTPTEEKVMRFIDKQIKDKGDWWMTSDEAVHYGFADGVLGQPGFETVEKIRINRKQR